MLRWDEVDGEYTYDEMSQNYRTPLDLRLEQGYQFWQDALCPKCGTPWWYGRTTDNRVQFEVTQTTCYACEELERFTEQVSSGKNPKKRHGVTDAVNPVGVYYEALGEREPLPTPFELIR